MDQADRNVVHAGSNGGPVQLNRRTDAEEPRIRIGSLYQAILPPFAPPVSPPPRPLARPVDDNDVAAAEVQVGVSELAVEAEADSGGSAVWLASRIKQSRTRQSEIQHTLCAPDPHHCCHPLISMTHGSAHFASRLCRHVASLTCVLPVDSYLLFVQTLFHKNPVSHTHSLHLHPPLRATLRFLSLTW